MLYTGEVNIEQKKIDVQNIATQWKQYKILIYTPTITAGVSFEEKHFDHLFAYYDPIVGCTENMV